MLIIWLASAMVSGAAAAPEATSQPRAELSIASSHRQCITSIVWSADGKRLLSTSVDNTARLWEVDNGALLRLFSPATDYVRDLGNGLSEAVFVNADRQLVICGSDGTRLWNVADGKLLAMLDKNTDMVSAVAANDITKMIVTTGTGDPSKGAQLFLRIHTLGSVATRDVDVRGIGGIAAIALSPDGSKLALAGSIITRETPGGTEVAALVRVIDPRDGRIINEVRSASNSASWVRFDGETRIIYRVDGQVFLRELATARTVSFKVTTGALSGNGAVVALYPGNASRTSDNNATVAAELYAVANGRRLEALPWAGAQHERTVNRVLTYAFRPDGEQLAIGFADGKIAVWTSRGALTRASGRLGLSGRASWF